jgi:hypothetical protein
VYGCIRVGCKGVIITLDVRGRKGKGGGGKPRHLKLPYITTFGYGTGRTARLRYDLAR